MPPSSAGLGVDGASAVDVGLLVCADFWWAEPPQPPPASTGVANPTMVAATMTAVSLRVMPNSIGEDRIFTLPDDGASGQITPL